MKEYNDSIAAHWIGSYVVVANSKAKDGGSKLFKVDKQGNVDICDSETGDQNHSPDYSIAVKFLD